MKRLLVLVILGVLLVGNMVVYAKPYVVPASPDEIVILQNDLSNSN